MQRRMRPRVPSPISSILHGRRSTGRWRARCEPQRFWWIALGYFCGLYIWYAVQVHQTKYLLDIGFNPGVAAFALGLVSLLGIPGQILLGHLSDRLGREAIWAASCLGFAICFAALIALAYAPTLLLLYIMVAAQGALGYGLTSIMGAVVLEIFEGKQFGSIFGTLMLVALAGGAAGPLVTGILHDIYGSYIVAFTDRYRGEPAFRGCDLAGWPRQDTNRCGPTASLARRYGRQQNSPSILQVRRSLAEARGL